MGLDQNFYKLKRMSDVEKEKVLNRLNNRGKEESIETILCDLNYSYCNSIEDDNFVNVSKETLKEYGCEFKDLLIYDTEELAYFRKNNWLRKFIVDNTDYEDDYDCVYLRVTRDLLKTLLNDINNVLDNNSKAEELLPTQSGFFFGSTEYDRWYFNDLGNSKEKIQRIINITTDGDVILYYEWW